MKGILTSFLSLALMFAELFAAELVFGKLLKRREKFFTRAVISALTAFASIFLTILIYYAVTGNAFSYNQSGGADDSFFKFCLYCAIFLLSVCANIYCFENPIWTVLFYSAGAYAAQHLAVNLTRLLLLAPFWENLLALAPYLSFIVETLVCAIVYFGVYFLLVRNKTAQEKTIQTKRKVVFSLVVVFICIGISRLTADDNSRGTLAFFAETISTIVNCLFILTLHFNITENDEMHYEVSLMEEILHREKEQYKLSKETIDLINVKCHDLKHQINALRAGSSDKTLKDIEESVMIYDSSVKTGNDVLDVILTEKSLYCVKNNIRLQCMANGKDLAFMDSMDIYSLFGNALSNAIESVSKIEEDKRFIALNVTSAGNMLSVHMENYYEGEIVFENGLPKTSRDTGYHGFGVKSMSYIVKKYNGYMNMNAESGVFTLDIVFPVSAAR